MQSDEVVEIGLMVVSMVVAGYIGNLGAREVMKAGELLHGGS